MRSWEARSAIKAIWLKHGRREMNRALIAAIVLVAFTPGCSQHIRIAKYVIPPPPTPGSEFVAGRGKAEITPPPGYPMGGHSIAGKIGRGYWTRLYARAFYFRDGDGRRLVLVSCDLFAIPAALRSQVAKFLNDRANLKRDPRISIPPDRIIIAATHTHHGPGNFYSSALYNGFSSPCLGFDQVLFDWIANRIADAIQEAEGDGEGHSSVHHQLILKTGVALDIQRNRAVDAFLRNDEKDRQAFLAEFASSAPCPNPSDTDCLRYRAVDPTLKVLEVVRSQDGETGKGKRIAALVFYAVHPTAMSHDNPLFSSDLAGRAMSLIERNPSQNEDKLIAGFFNGAEGDVSPRWKNQDRSDVIALGNALADDIRRELDRPARPVEQDDSPKIRVVSAEFQANPPRLDTRSHLASRPEFGVAALGGAEDGRTIMFQYGFHGGVLNEGKQTDQGVKQPGLDLPNIKLLTIVKPTSLLAPPKGFPKAIPISFAQLGTLLSVGAIPFETTSMMGYRIKRELKKDMKTSEFALVGLANEYLSYMTTPEEYDAQDYEGASTIFGPQSGPVVQELLQTVARRVDEGGKDKKVTIQPVVFNVGGKPLIPFGPRFAGERHSTIDEGLEQLMPDATGRVDIEAPRFEWCEAEATDPMGQHRRVSILQNDGSGQWKPLKLEDGLEDDTGSDLLTVLVEGPNSKNSNRLNWAAIWIVPAGAPKNSEYRFQVEPGDASGPYVSESFRLNQRQPIQVVKPGCTSRTP